VAGTCWLADTSQGATWKTDAGLVAEDDQAAADPFWAASFLRLSLTNADLPWGSGDHFVDQDGSEIALRYHAEVPAGVAAFDIGGQVRRYPRIFHYVLTAGGTSRPGDSGTVVCRTMFKRRRLIGLLIGALDFEGAEGIGVVTFDDIRRVVRSHHGTALELAPSSA